jgi:hypothetical protein
MVYPVSAMRGLPRREGRGGKSASAMVAAAATAFKPKVLYPYHF